jgi:hypothetical protein
LSEAAQSEAFHLLCDDKIGYGCSRSVYSSQVLRDCVVKVEEKAGRFQIVIEWETWQRVQGTPFEKWFAPCRWISPNGIVLVMTRTVPATSFPEKMPAFLWDFKRTNYGMLGDRFVCHDYGHTKLLEYGMTKRMQEADWRDEP